MSELAQVLESVKALQESFKKSEEVVAKQNETLSQLQKTHDDLKSKSPFLFDGTAPGIRRGENSMSSRGFSFLKALGCLSGAVEKENAVVEWGVSDKLKKYHSAYKGYKPVGGRSFFMPIAGDHIVEDASLAQEVKDATTAGSGPVDMDELKFLRKQMASMGYTKALSWIDETVGGALVAPPQFGELIEVLRVNETFMAAGARVLPMPPQGRITFPAQKTAMTAYHVGESQLLTDSTPGTGDLTLQAKKLTILAKIPNELFHFSAIPIEAFVREDMTKVISIAMDKALWESADSDTTPKGLINYSNINKYTSVDPGNTLNGFRFQPADAYNMVATVEEQNASFKAFVMRPLLWSTFVTRRSDAVTAGDGKGPFVFSLIRNPQDGFNLTRLQVGNLLGYPVFKSTQFSTTRALGSSTNLTYAAGGDFTDYVVAMGGALEFQVSTQGDTPFTLDQTWFKGVMYYDGGPRHEASFVLCDTLYANQ